MTSFRSTISRMPLTLTLIAACMSAPPASAQQASVAEFWLDLENVVSMQGIAALRAPAEVDDVIAQSLKLVREYELNPKRSTAYEARWDLRRALARNPHSAAHHLALALLLRRGPDAVIRLDSTEHNNFIDPRSLASAHTLRSLRRALELDPQLELAAVELARFAVERHHPELLVEADAALARVEQTAEVLLQRAAIALEQQNSTRALTHATAAALAGADRSRVAHARGVALLLDPATEKMGAADYLAGLDRASEAAVREYHAAAAPTFTLAETAAWDTMPQHRRADWLRERWEIRSLMSGVSVGERLGVHFRRMYAAFRDYPLYAPLRDAERMGGMAVLLGEDLRRHGLAPAGVMLTRFGDPGRLRWAGVCGADTIPYIRTDTMSMASPLDEFVPPGTRHLEPLDVDVYMHEDSKAMRSLDCDNVASFRQFIQAMIEGERYRPAFDSPMLAQAELYAFRAPDGADIVVGLTVPRRDIVDTADRNGTVRLTTAVAFVDTTARRTSRAERLLQFSLPDTVATHVLLAAPLHTQLHGSVDVRITLHDTERSVGSVLGMVHAIPDFSGTDLQLSDLVIAPDADAGRLRRGDVSLAIAAGRQYRVGESFELYYEIYGLGTDEAYRTRIVVAPQTSALWRAARQITGREQDVLTLEFDSRATASHEVFGVQELRTLGTSTLRPGTYRLLVEIVNVETGTRTTRERLFDITG